ncbi:nucleotidyltransferase domain-containing protein [Saccharibacillus sp. JS10]|uniref:nucleotidyltransferase domain-containing protein n=1 Tax=Saccharibacillus sp. JS10 TaxID=2950552 RepID=UPI00210D97FD|nr:nucleotidyltransferase domain-containing protein [Saccharibacillus sp. JS10]MCQ4085343.1 nucleotidyltransferase domain-containing protein [Saccharibacillus sp. JS10]
MTKLNVFDVSSALIQRIGQDYAEDVAIAAYYGSYIDGTATERSDLDFFFIPSTPRGKDMALSFIVNGISFDFWPISWERAESMARMEDSKTGILADSKLLYVGSDNDLDRFNALKKQIQDICSFEGETYFLDLAEKKLQPAYPLMMEFRRSGVSQSLSDCRLQSFDIITPALEALTLANRTYLKKGWGKNLMQLYNLSIRPSDLEKTLTTIMRSADISILIEACEHLLYLVQTLLNQRRTQFQTPTQNYKERAQGFFEEYKGLLDQLQTACERKDYEEAFFTAVLAESELYLFLVFCETGYWASGQEAIEQGRKIAQQAKLPALVSLIDPVSLIPLQSAAHFLEIQLERWFREKGVEIRKFEDLEQLREFLSSTPE